MTQAQGRMKLYADQHRKERVFEVGDWVYLKLQPFRQNSLSLRKNLKLATKYFGPYQVIEKVGAVAYRLDLPPESRIHPVFHVSLLKKYLGEGVLPSQALPPVDDSGIFLVFPVEVTPVDEEMQPRSDTLMVNVTWICKDWGIFSVEEEKYMKAMFPMGNPWGQGGSSPGGIVVNPNLAKRDGDEVAGSSAGRIVDGNMLKFDEEKIDEYGMKEKYMATMLMSEKKGSGVAEAEEVGK